MIQALIHRRSPHRDINGFQAQLTRIPPGRVWFGILVGTVMALLSGLPTPALAGAPFDCSTDSLNGNVPPPTPPPILPAEIVLRVYVHAIEGPDSLAWSDAELDATLEVLRADLVPFGIHVQEVGRADADGSWASPILGFTVDFFNGDSIGAWSLALEFPQGYETDGLHLYFGTKNYPQGCPELIYHAHGAAFDTSSPYGEDPIDIYGLALYGADCVESHLLSHEVGHLLGLEHTWIDDIQDTPPAPDFRLAETCCDVDGGASLVNSACEFVYTAEQDACSVYDLTDPDYSEADPTDIMCYSSVDCHEWFSPGQGARMRETLRYLPQFWTTVDFVNRSTDTSFDFTATPYSSVPLDYDGDGDLDLFLTNPNGNAGLMENQENTTQTDVRKLYDRQSGEFAFSETPEDARGASVADFDNDGDLELFVAAEAGARLYDNTGSTEDYFEEIGGAITLFSTYTEDSWTGVWGDYDRDGWVDLYVGRAGTSSGAPSGALADKLLRNVSGASLVDVSSAVGLGSVTSTTTTGAAWADANADGELDIFVSAAGASEASKLLIQSIELNVSTYEYEHAFGDSSSYIPASLDYISGASWRDLNNDGDLDLLLSGTAGTADGARILWNDGSGDLTTTDLVDGGFASAGHDLFDANLDGSPDLVLASSSATVSPGVFYNMNDGTQPSFADYGGFAGVAVGGTYAATAISAVDIAGASNAPDGDEDLYIGRASSSEAFFYQNAHGGVDAPTNKWLRVKLDADNRPHNQSAIGVTVKAQTTLAGSVELIQTQVVDGGRGAGGQGAPTLTFGLRNTTDSVDLTITWPDGFVQNENVSNGSLNSTITITDDHTAGLDGSSASAYAVMNVSSNADWVFEWETNYLCDPAFDTVIIDGGGGHGCPTVDVTLTDASSNTTVEVFALPGGGYLHRFTWTDQACVTPCNYDYKVISSVASGVAQGTGWKTFSISACAN